LAEDVFTISLLNLFLSEGTVAFMASEFRAFEGSKAHSATYVNFWALIDVVLVNREHRAELCSVTHRALPAVQFMVIDLVPRHSRLAWYTLDLCLHDQVFQESVNLHKLWVIDLATRAFVSVDCEGVWDTFLAHVPLALGARALLRLSQEVATDSALKLFIDVLHGGCVSNSLFCEIEILTPFFGPTECLIALMMLREVISGPLNRTKLAAEHEFLTSIYVMVVHFLLYNSILITHLTFSALFSMLLKLIEVWDLLTTKGSILTVEFHCAHKPE
jgi:hypothetical protein